MSDQATPAEQNAPAAKTADESYPGSEFNKQDLAEFSADDTEASANIGKMLTIFFAYSLFAMMVVTAWTFWVSQSN